MKYILFSTFILVINSALSQRFGDTGIKPDTIFWDAVSKMGTSPDIAIELFRNASFLYKEIGNNKRFCLSLQGIAATYKEIGEFAKEQEAWFEAYNQSKILRNEIPEYFSDCLLGLSDCLLKLGAYEKAEKYYLEAIKVKEQVLNPEDSVMHFQTYFAILNDLGLTYIRLGAHENAIRINQYATHIGLKVNKPLAYNTIANKYNIGYSYHNCEQFENAKPYFYDVARLINKNKLPYLTILYDTYHSLSFMYLKMQERDSVFKVYKNNRKAT